MVPQDTNRGEHLMPQECNRIPHDEKGILAMINIDYQTLVLSAFEENKNISINNSSIYQALYLSKLLIKKAKNRIRIFSGKLTEAFFCNGLIRTELEEKIKQGIPVTIIIEKDGNEIPQWLRVHNVEIRLIKNSSIRNHMLLIDDLAYRVEEEHDLEMFSLSPEKYKVTATANFNDKKTASALNFVFESHLLNVATLV
jgi:hypothetical protein